MALHWVLSAAALLVATAALMRVRRASKRLERLNEMYWELRYEHGQLRSRLMKLEPPDGSAPGDALAATGRPAGGSATQFVPLSSLKR